MVKLTKIYTRTGDDGTTGLASGGRVRKDDPRVEAYGCVDECNAALGVAIVSARRTDAALAKLLESLQHDLFDCGADLATPIEPGEAPGSKLRIVESQTRRLEALIDEHNGPLGTLASFVLPGGSEVSAHLHVARTMARRAERACVALHSREPRGTSLEALRYLNRLSDLLFVLARWGNGRGKDDVLWKPGAGRGEGPAR